MFNLQVLNDKDFEDLCKDLLELELNVKLQSFKKGRDSGIDLRYSTNEENKIIIQAKHFIGSKYSDLKHHILKIEKEKIEKLNPKPERYILITSLALSPKQIDEIVAELKPYTKSSNDIYGLDRLMSILNGSNEIIEKHYKLWMSSTAVLERILNNGIKGKSEFYKEKILKKLSLYVPTKNYSTAIEKLNDHKFIIITGAPGVGKTTISYLLICDLLSKDYQLIYINDRIYEAEQMLSPDPRKKQVFYFDDFLGSNIYDILHSKNSESSIIGFIERIQSSKNKFLILTTRTTILNQAHHNFEKLKRSKLDSLSKYEIELTEYSRLDKAKILYNHLYHTKIQVEIFDKIRNNKTYLKIINHPNYSPRLIEFITNIKNFQLSSESEYLNFVFSNLENPQEVWKSAYENQLEDEDRFLLTTIFSLGGYNVKGEILETAFNSRLRYEIMNSGHVLKNNSYNNSLKKLLDGFISSQRLSQTNFFSFLNPSVGDFLLNYIKQSKIEKWRIIRSVIYVDQLTQYFHPNQLEYIPFTKSELDEFLTFFNAKATTLNFIDGKEGKASKEIEILKFYISYFEEKIPELDLLPWVKAIVPSQISRMQFDNTITILNKIAISQSLRNAVLLNWKELIHNLYGLAKYTEEYESIKLLFAVFNENFEKFMLEAENQEYLAYCLSSSFSESISDDPHLSDFTIERAIEYYQSGNPSRARTIISDALYEDYSGFIDDLGLTEYHDKLIDHFEVDDGSILEKIIRNRYSDHEDYEGGRIGPSNNHGYASEMNQIEKLFE